MVRLHISPVLFLVLVFLTAPILARDAWHTFWASNFDNCYEIPKSDRLNGPRSNPDLYKQLLKDSAGHTASPHQSKSLGDCGYTWFWTAKIDTLKVIDHYLDYSAVRAVYLHKDYDDDYTDIFSVSSSGNATEIGQTSPSPMHPHQAFKRDVKHDHDAPRQLKFISAPESAHNKLDDRSYDYGAIAGEGVRIYVIESGLDNSKDLFNGDVQYLYAEPFSKSTPGDLNTKTNHGTIMADLAAGKTHGVAKLADVTAVQIDNYSSSFLRGLGLEHVIDALAQIVDDVKDKEQKAVINMSFGECPSHGENFNEARWNAFTYAFYRLMVQLDSMQVSLVGAAPNGMACATKGHYPCSMANPSSIHYVSNMIAVGGGLINDGNYWGRKEHNDDWLTVWGPADDQSGGGVNRPGIVAQWPEGFTGYRVGTSCATAMVSGLVAYWRGLGLSHQEAKVKLQALAYKRNDNGPPMIWNGQP